MKIDVTSYEYKRIALYYGDRVAQRSQVPLINHINEGLMVLDIIGAGLSAKAAFCLHPIFQSDADLAKGDWKYNITSPYVMMLVMEYRSVANEYLSDKVNACHKIRLSPLKDVNDMLIADKIQNRKDFELYHKGKHARSEELDLYFKEWLEALGIAEGFYQFIARRL